MFLRVAFGQTALMRFATAMGRMERSGEQNAVGNGAHALEEFPKLVIITSHFGEVRVSIIKYTGRRVWFSFLSISPSKSGTRAGTVWRPGGLGRLNGLSRRTEGHLPCLKRLLPSTKSNWPNPTGQIRSP